MQPEDTALDQLLDEFSPEELAAKVKKRARERTIAAILAQIPTTALTEEQIEGLETLLSSLVEMPSGVDLDSTALSLSQAIHAHDPEKTWQYCIAFLGVFFRLRPELWQPPPPPG